jgi:hypothetical protein
MIQMPPEWVEMAWAARDAAAPTLNAARRAWFDCVKCVIRESDLPPSIVNSNSNVMRFKSK